MEEYLVTRYGSNSANQPMQNERAMGFIRAENYDAAKDLANIKWECYNNQHLGLEAKDEVDNDVWNDLIDAELPIYEKASTKKELPQAQLV